ncbi:hypothetical protein [Mesorhizobium sp. M0091]|uniref:hypothetical protein n=1 Tax=Mesorhizobium sp. M0091 TaxID=2956875 RepID=UPI00333A718B
MTLSLAPINHGELCHGWAWTIEDEDILAQRVGRVALGQYRHVARILTGAAIAGPSTTTDHIAGATKFLTVEKGKEPWHRDGWLFQTISWIAAHQIAQGTITRPPHALKAHKGFDGMQLEIGSDGKSIVAVVVFEDKATSDAKGTIQGKVWPGIVSLEAGERLAELTHEASAMLETQQHLNPDLDIDAAIANILWKEARRYRVSVTVSATDTGEGARADLFKGFDVKAPGDVKRRRAETIHIPDLRIWMEVFAQRTIQHLNAVHVHV